MNEEKALQARLVRTWGAFFRRHGNFTATQKAAIPLILDGKNLVLSAPTASGKTEAVLAPLVENYLPPRRTPALRILYILPTRALIHDLQMRLATICDSLQISLAVKTYDLNNFSPIKPSDILLTTPESFDSLMANQAKMLINVQAVILDELHYLDSTVRGDQLRVLLQRLRQIREYAYTQGDAPNSTIQYVALSATLSDGEALVERYFPQAVLVSITGERPIQAEMLPIDAKNPQTLLAYFEIFQARGWRKALAFCNTRAEVEAYASYVRQAKTVFGEEVFTHYSNLAPERRHVIETQFAESNAALCFATNTLELGIDIGSIDIVLLIGAPADSAAFFQRIGRANRRQKMVQAAYFYRSNLEQQIFELFPSLDSPHVLAPMRLAVIVQQLFSLLKQSPSHGLRLVPLLNLLGDFIAQHELENILGQLQALNYLQVARLGEWRAADKLNRLIDEQAFTDNPLSIYSNIDKPGQASVEIRDKYSHKVMARVDINWLARDKLTLEGQQLDVMWQDKRSLLVSKTRPSDAIDKPFYLSSRQSLSFELAQALGEKLGWQAGTAPFIKDVEGGVYLFHWLGDIYGRIFYDLLRPHQIAYETNQQGLCLYLGHQPSKFPEWHETMLRKMLERSFMRYESQLQLGAYQFLLPRDLRRKTVLDQLNLPRLVQALNRIHPILADEQSSAQLVDLLN